MNKKAVIIDQDGGIIMDTMMEYRKDGTVVMTQIPPQTEKLIQPPGIVRFFVLQNYMEFYQGTVYQAEKDKMYLNNITPEGENKKQQDVKVNIRMDQIITYYQDKQLMGCRVKMKDLSAGGMCFSTNVNLDSQRVYEIITSLTKEPLLINFKIVRQIRSENGKEFIYGCKFLNIGPDEEKMLRNTVFRLLGLKFKHHSIRFKEAK